MGNPRWPESNPSMPDNSRLGQHNPFGLPSKVAIPRLTRPDRQSSKVQVRHRDRVPRACRNCHKRKVKCSGGLPRCNFCEKINRPCVYEATRRDRLATATDRNEHLVSLLKDLSGRVDDEDRLRIENALNNDSDDDIDSPEPSSAGGSIRFQTVPYSQSSGGSRQPSYSHVSPSSTFYAPDTESATPTMDRNSERNDSTYDGDVLPEDGTHVLDEHTAGYLGQVCEVHWLHDLKSRVQMRGSSIISTVVPRLGDANFYLDDRDVQLVEQQNPFHLPPDGHATALLQRYLQTVHVMFPILSSDIEQQLQIYYQSARMGDSVTFPQRWFAIVNLVLVIGARFSHLVDQRGHGGPLMDEAVYLSSACQLLGLNNSSMIHEAPDLPLIQATALLAFYYMSIGLINRAWVAIGTALRFAIAYGLHAQARDSSTDPQLKQVLVRTWWSLHNLESLLSSMIGRPCMLRSEDISTPLPSEVDEDRGQQDVGNGPSMSFPDAQVRLSGITQEVLSLLYIRRRVPRSWAQTHAVITSMMSELDEWALLATPQPLDGSPATPNDEKNQLMLRKQYCRLKILITRPSLRRIQRCVEVGVDDPTAFDQEMAETCIQTAQVVASLLPADVNLQLAYEKGPWWTITHNIMQALAVLLIGISCRPYFESSYADSVAGTKKLVTWLQHMRETNEQAKRGYQVIYNIIKAPNLVDPMVWQDVAGLFSDERVVQPAQPAQGHGQMAPGGYWAGGEQPQTLSSYPDPTGFGYYNSHPV